MAGGRNSHIEVDHEHNGHLFFWLFHNRHIANRQRLVIWLNGGPGCSSMDGALMEVGPYRLKDDKTLRYNDGSWDEFANLLFVDQPVGTGFSYANTNSYLHELNEMADSFMVFLEKFFKVFPEYETDDVRASPPLSFPASFKYLFLHWSGFVERANKTLHRSTWQANLTPASTSRT